MLKEKSTAIDAVHTDANRERAILPARDIS
jgi:hypothetical protein